jgi:hypothetical protein
VSRVASRLWRRVSSCPFATISGLPSGELHAHHDGSIIAMKKIACLTVLSPTPTSQKSDTQSRCVTQAHFPMSTLRSAASGSNPVLLLAPSYHHVAHLAVSPHNSRVS